MKTRVEIDELIARWLEGPDWELEESDGFEDHKDELLAVRHKRYYGCNEWACADVGDFIDLGPLFCARVQQLRTSDAESS